MAVKNDWYYLDIEPSDADGPPQQMSIRFV